MPREVSEDQDLPLVHFRQSRKQVFVGRSTKIDQTPRMSDGTFSNVAAPAFFFSS